MNFRAAAFPVMDHMKTRVSCFAIATAVLLGMAGARMASAQYASQATIPFAFSANHKFFPTGHYRVIRESEDYLTVVNIEAGIKSEIMVRTDRDFKTKPRNSLLFLHDDRGYHLLSARFAQGNLSMQTELTLQPKAEREIARVSARDITELGTD